MIDYEFPFTFTEPFRRPFSFILHPFSDYSPLTTHPSIICVFGVKGYLNNGHNYSICNN